MKIYTKKGDKGETSLFNGDRVKKNNLRVDTYGTIDELNSVLGVILSYIKNLPHEEQIKKDLLQIQDDLLVIGSILANPSLAAEKLGKEKEHLLTMLERFEKHIDEMTAALPKLTNFILPGGGKIGSYLQLARTTARKAERKIVALLEKEKIMPEIIMYFNRLSDLFFTQSRFINFKEGRQETIWKKQ